MVQTRSLSPLPRNAHSVPFVELRQSLASQVSAISLFVDQLMRFILKFRNADGSETDIEMALHEALARIIHIFEDNKSLICYKHVVETVFEAANEASECLTIAQHSVCCSQEFFTSP